MAIFEGWPFITPLKDKSRSRWPLYGCWVSVDHPLMKTCTKKYHQCISYLWGLDIRLKTQIVSLRLTQFKFSHWTVKYRSSIDAENLMTILWWWHVPSIIIVFLMRCENWLKCIKLTLGYYFRIMHTLSLYYFIQYCCCRYTYIHQELMYIAIFKVQFYNQYFCATENILSLSEGNTHESLGF